MQLVRASRRDWRHYPAARSAINIEGMVSGNHMPILRAYAMLTLTLLIGGLAAGAATQPSEADRAALLIRQLDDPDAQVRRQASMQLNSLGGDALPVVAAAAEQGDLSPELRRRLTVALKYLRPRARRETMLRQRSQWETKAWLGAYEKAGQNDPSWDADARRGISLYVQTGPDPKHGTLAQRDAAIEALSSAVRKRCNDPLVESLYAMMDGTGSRETTRSPSDGSLMITVPECLRRDYPPSVKLQLMQAFIGSNVPVDPRVLRRVPELLRAVASQPDLPKGELDALALQFFLAVNRTPYEQQVFPAFLVAYEQAAPGTGGPLILKARGLMHQAYLMISAIDAELRPQSWRPADPQLRQAEEALNAAWSIDPSDASIATLMIDLKRVDGSNDRQGMEDWFRRAMDANPDDYEACVRKLDYLSPFNHGNPRDMLDFGRECLNTQNWRGRVPLILVRAHEFLANQSGDTKVYFSRPEVWQDIFDVYEGALLNFPNDRLDRSMFASYAAKCGRWPDARRQFERLGDKPDLTAFGSMASYDYLRRKAARLASAPATQPQHGDAAR